MEERKYLQDLFDHCKDHPARHQLENYIQQNADAHAAIEKHHLEIAALMKQHAKAIEDKDKAHVASHAEKDAQHAAALQALTAERDTLKLALAESTDKGRELKRQAEIAAHEKEIVDRQERMWKLKEPQVATTEE